MSGPTPGPWHVDVLGAGWTDGHGIAYCDNGHVAWTTRGFGDDVQLANAHLIAAAPDLYEALEAALNDPDAGWLHDAVYNSGMAALAKARGEV